MNSPMNGQAIVESGGVAIPLPGRRRRSPRTNATAVESPESVMSIRIPRWALPFFGAMVLGAISWMTHLTLALSDVQQTQARSEYLFESHSELRDDVREQAKLMAEIRRSLVRIEARLEQ